jgi:hypothetical protein
MVRRYASSKKPNKYASVACCKASRALDWY